MTTRLSNLLVIALMGTMTLVAANEVIGRIAKPAPQIAPAIVTEPTRQTVVITPVATTPTTTTSTTTTTAHDVMQADLEQLALDPSVPCQEWAPLALMVGWPVEELQNVLEEMWSESRCINIIPGHPNFNGGDHGPMQINTVWSDETANLFGSWDAINDPAVNLAMALEIWRWHQANHGCGWEPWSRPC